VFIFFYRFAGGLAILPNHLGVSLMEIFEFFLILWDHRNTHAFCALLVYGVPALTVLILVFNHWEARRYQVPKRTEPMHQLRHYKGAVRDFDKEVGAWEQALGKPGRHRP
jgi:hypothetical protein